MLYLESQRYGVHGDEVNFNRCLGVGNAFGAEFHRPFPRSTAHTAAKYPETTTARPDTSRPLPRRIGPGARAFEAQDREGPRHIGQALTIKVSNLAMWRRPRYSAGADAPRKCAMLCRVTYVQVCQVCGADVLRTESGVLLTHRKAMARPTEKRSMVHIHRIWVIDGAVTDRLVAAPEQ